MENKETQLIGFLQNKLEEIDKRVCRVESDNKLQTYQFEQILKRIDELSNDVKELKSTPSKRWELILTAIITGVITMLVSQFTKLFN